MQLAIPLPSPPSQRLLSKPYAKTKSSTSERCNGKRKKGQIYFPMDLVTGNKSVVFISFLYLQYLRSVQEVFSKAISRYARDIYF